jgi:hypothetical protein
LVSVIIENLNKIMLQFEKNKSGIRHQLKIFCLPVDKFYYYSHHAEGLVNPIVRGLKNRN